MSPITACCVTDQSPVAEASGLLGEMVAFSRAACPRGGQRVMLGRGIEVPGTLVQVRAHRVEPVVLAETRVETIGCPQPGQRPVHLTDRNRAAERSRRVVGERDEFVIPSQDLRPVGLVYSRRVILQSRDRGLDLVLATPVTSERALQQAYPFGDLGTLP